jgi:hypothetical protein
VGVGKLLYDHSPNYSLQTGLNFFSVTTWNYTIKTGSSGNRLKLVSPRERLHLNPFSHLKNRQNYMEPLSQFFVPFESAQKNKKLDILLLLGVNVVWQKRIPGPRDVYKAL